MSKRNLTNDTHAKPVNGQQKLENAQRESGPEEQGAFQPHNARKEPLGPNTRR